MENEEPDQRLRVMRYQGWVVLAKTESYKDRAQMGLGEGSGA